MFCENCGREVKETDKFCMQCGCRIETEVPEVKVPEMEAPEVEATVENRTEMFPNMTYEKAMGLKVEEKKKNSGKIIGIIAAGLAAILLVVIVAFNFSVLANFAMKTFASPEKYYHYVEKKAFAENAETIATIYENYFLASLDTENQGVEGSVEVKLGDNTLDMIEGMAGMMMGTSDFSWLQEISVKTSGNKADELYQGELSLQLGEQEIVTGEAIIDMEEGQVYLGLPGLLESYALVEIPEDSYELEAFKNNMKSLEELYEKAPDKKAVEKLLYRYFCTAIEAVDNVNKKTEELEVEDISKKYTRLKVNFDEEAVLDIGEAVLKEMKSDDELEKIIIDVASVQEDIEPDDLYDEFREEIKYALEEIDAAKDNLKNYKSDSKCSMLVYVDAKGNICGREFKLQNGSQVEMAVGYKMPEKGKSFGYELYADSPDAVVEITGSGNRSGDKLSGDFVCAVDDTEVFEVSVTEYNTEEIKKGYLNGNFVFTVSEEISATAGIPNLSGYNAELDIHMTEDTREIKAIVHNDEEEMITLSSSFKQNNGEKVKLPSKSDVVEIKDDEDVMNLMKELDFDKLLDSLRSAGLPSEIIDPLDFYLSLM